jgi:hypothetical protein
MYDSQARFSSSPIAKNLLIELLGMSRNKLIYIEIFIFGGVLEAHDAS